MKNEYIYRLKILTKVMLNFKVEFEYKVSKSMYARFGWYMPSTINNVLHNKKAGLIEFF